MRNPVGTFASDLSTLVIASVNVSKNGDVGRRGTSLATGTATGGGSLGLELGPTAALYTQLETFKKDMTLVHTGDFSHSCLGYAWRKELPVNTMLVLGRGDRILKARDAAPKGSRASPGGFSWSIGSGDWLAAISPNEGNALLYVNRGVPLARRINP